MIVKFCSIERNLYVHKKVIICTFYLGNFYIFIFSFVRSKFNSKGFESGNFYRISGQVFVLISSFLSNRRLQMDVNGKSSQECAINTGVPEGSILGPALFLLDIDNFPNDVICKGFIYLVRTHNFLKTSISYPLIRTPTVAY